jgi:hypothetical protein
MSLSISAPLDNNGQVQVATNPNPALAGASVLFTEKDHGTITGSRSLGSPEVSETKRLKVGLETMIDQELFNYTNQRTNKHWYKITTLTMVLSSQGLVTNGLGVTTQNTGCSLNTHRHFPLFTSAPLIGEFDMTFSNFVPGANTVINYGFFLPGAANFYAPLDGVGFRWTSAGLFGFQNYNGTENLTGVISTFTPVVGTVYHYKIVVTQLMIEFWINNVLYATMNVSTGNPQPAMMASFPLSINHYITNNGAAGNACQPKFTGYAVFMGDQNAGKPWADIMASMGLNAQLLPEGNASGSFQTPVIPAYNADGATITPSTTAAGANGLGGMTEFALVASEATAERIIFSYQNPAAAVNVTGRNIVIKGIRICAAVRTLLVAPTAGNNAYAVMMGYGASAITPATAEATTFANPTTKNYRKLYLGHQSFTTPAAPIGSLANDIDVKFVVPHILHPGEWWTVLIREFNCGAGGLVQMTCHVDAHYE